MTAVEFEVNVVHDAPELIDLCELAQLPALVRGLFGHVQLTGAHPRGSRIDDVEDFQRRSPDWLTYLQDGRPDETLTAPAEARAEDHPRQRRIMVQGALASLWGRSPVLVPCRVSAPSIK